MLTLPVDIAVNAPTSVVEFAHPHTSPTFTIDQTSVTFYRYGMLVPLLPNWPRPFVKFSGAIGAWLDWEEKFSVDISEREYRSLSLLLEAFCHYIWVKSGGEMIIADVQGELYYTRATIADFFP